MHLRHHLHRRRCFPNFPSNLTNNTVSVATPKTPVSPGSVSLFRDWFNESVQAWARQVSNINRGVLVIIAAGLGASAVLCLVSPLGSGGGGAGHQHDAVPSEPLGSWGGGARGGAGRQCGVWQGPRCEEVGPEKGERGHQRCLRPGGQPALLCV